MVQIDQRLAGCVCFSQNEYWTFMSTTQHKHRVIREPSC